ncbi:hypothetical protein POM88_051251 [Heracleum sosnowskyi]|uniref:Uncharacterized protein n=1 Tax=Heracleum sosnowskyi TaxID=360622 RepID=A0AAD8GZ17_9APIA|nr:hypothetical protein POM88_051251 [Heracleum sosnowskyi]
MSRFIDLVETFDFSTLTYFSYGDKIDGLLKRFPNYEKNERFRTVLPEKYFKTADDYFSIKFCTLGRYPIYGIYSRRDLNLVGVCVHGNIMYALDDCDLNPSFVPDLNVRKLCLEIRYSPLAARETLNCTKKCMCSAISTLSLGYTPQKKNEWCEAVVLLTGITSQAVRFSKMKAHVQRGLLFKTAHCPSSFNGRYELSDIIMAKQHRWNKISEAIRRGKYPYVFSFYTENGPYATATMCEYSARDVLLINDSDKTKREEYRRRINRWNGPLGNSQRKCQEEAHRRSFLETEAKRIMKKMDNNSSERMHGSWYGSLDTFNYEVACVNHLPTLAQIVGGNRLLVSATCHLANLKDVLQAQRTLASTFVAVQNIWNEGGLLAFFRGASMILEKWGFNLDGADSKFSANPRKFQFDGKFKCMISLQAATHRAIVDGTCHVFSAAAFYLCAKRCEVKVRKIRMPTEFNTVSTSGGYGTSKVKVDPKNVKWNRELGTFVQLLRGRSSGSLGATCVCRPLQVITRRWRLSQ